MSLLTEAFSSDTFECPRHYPGSAIWPPRKEVGEIGEQAFANMLVMLCPLAFWCTERMFIHDHHTPTTHHPPPPTDNPTTHAHTHTPTKTHPQKGGRRNRGASPREHACYAVPTGILVSLNVCLFTTTTHPPPTTPPHTHTHQQKRTSTHAPTHPPATMYNHPP